MSLFQAFVLGLVQGITEFLPISSSGFLILTPTLLGWEVQSLAFDAFLHVATLLAVVAALWNEVKAISLALLANRKDQESLAVRQLARGIVFATIPILIVGFVLQEILMIEFRSVGLVAWSFIVWGIVLYVVDRRAGKNEPITHLSRPVHRNLGEGGSGQMRLTTEVGMKRAMFIGLAQALAIIPGTSRSGITITAGLASGLSRETATRFSFLLAIPAIAAAGFFELGSVARGGEIIELAPLVVGFFTAAVTGFLTVRMLLRYIRRYTFRELAIFRVLVGVLIVLLV